MTYTIVKRFHFSASHQLSGLGDHHQCARLHGHNYAVELELSGSLDDNGMVFDYGRLLPFADVIATLDHRHLNDLFSFNPTAELLAAWLHDEAVAVLDGDLPETVYVAAVRVMETPRTVAEFRR